MSVLSDMSEKSIVESMLSEVRRDDRVPTGLLSRQSAVGSFCLHL